MTALCDIVGVCSSSFYKWQSQGSQVKTRLRLEQQEAVERVFWEHKRRYGVRRIRKQLRAEGMRISRETIREIMRDKALVPKGRKRFKRTTISGDGTPKAKNILNRNFNPETRDVAWLSDITYLPNATGGFYYLAVVIKLCSREILGWAVGSTMEASRNPIDLTASAWINFISSSCA